ncbi:transposase [Roseospira navarrensis]|uniref:Transposase n=2 Tax=Roseospira navarrensis TaxID=140058 RepID=A0A7X1ZG03_9PROT|nr:transposase [Roseospira navarrensis]MQX37775.1 transposase [Roseospira navarrensis]
MRLEIVETGRRRRFSDAEKVRIVEESFVGSRQASATARRYGICTSLIFRWRKLWQESRLGVQPADNGSAPAFVPAVILPYNPQTCIDEEPEAAPAPSEPPPRPIPPHDRIEIVAPSGYRVIVGADIDGDALRRVLAVVEAR